MEDILKVWQTKLQAMNQDLVAKSIDVHTPYFFSQKFLHILASFQQELENYLS